jgi:triosephosphate isomerase
MKNRKHLVVANWKMNPISPEEAKRIIRSTKKTAKELRRTEVAICPPFVYLPFVKPEPKEKIYAGVQDVFWQPSGTYTGEVSPEMARQSSAGFVIIGHSDRRNLGETNEIVSKKANASLAAGLQTIVCVGEKTRDDTGDYLEFLKKQLTESLAGVKKKFLSELIVAYEPIWAISKSYAPGEAMKPSDVQETVLYLKKVLSGIFGKDWVRGIRILYGGSVNGENAGFIVGGGGVDGLLVGRESLNPKGFGFLLHDVDRVPL